jgi:hypothetical protein
MACSARIAFGQFTDGIMEWWPKNYTWSQHKLIKMEIPNRVGSFCTEFGPHGFRCDWGRVTRYTEAKEVAFTWQIAMNRAPEPDPQKASEVIIRFNELSGGLTRVEFQHIDFSKHGNDWRAYLEAMDSEDGWDLILQGYKESLECVQNLVL